MARAGWRHERRGGAAWIAAYAPTALLLLSPPRAALADEPRIAEHSLATGYHAVLFRTEADDNYALHGPSLAYELFIGRRWGFMLRGAAYFPVFGQMSGPSGEWSGGLLDAYDQRHLGLDGLFLAARRTRLAEKLVLTGAFGAHVQGFSLNGTDYSPVEEISLGVGGLGKLDYQVNRWFACSLELAGGLDFIDLVDHRNPASLVVPLALSFAVGARY